VRYVEDKKKATLAEFDKEEAEWRETAERQSGKLLPAAILYGKARA
jgi:hypothetical protein